MVKQVTSLGRSGLHDWMIQRVSAVVLAAYTIFLLGYLVCGPDVTYEAWREFFGCLYVKLFTLIAIAALAAHAWIGIWTVCTDYIKCSCIRMVVQSASIIACLVYVAWGALIVWGV
ncbi:MAG: succinate dehydrogenase, hydrophobic membrane anchor protein [Kangiellaceae bacterium]|jgi:succinate dehydrogenase / fumarate reductase membrane anchor subunit|nr:succinate dehydrogenase, hydrophobic membrane anchor protein [Kangiellaceae bacterium]|tara:strand:- start:11515 stop:11862 length:348 start_codon:yes stop_codon:yes gene_type:complete